MMKVLVWIAAPFALLNAYLARLLHLLGLYSLSKPVARVTMDWCRWGYRMCGRDPKELE